MHVLAACADEGDGACIKNPSMIKTTGTCRHFEYIYVFVKTVAKLIVVQHVAMTYGFAALSILLNMHMVSNQFEHDGRDKL